MSNTRVLPWVSLLFAVGLPLCAVAQVAGIKVGNETKRASGTVIQQEMGDTACYLTLRDDSGKEFTEMADFELCVRQPMLRGKKVLLGYVEAKIMDESCGGDTGCRKTRQVALINSVSVVSGRSSTGEAKSVSATQASFCTSSETTVFACRSGGKLVSVCADPSSSATNGYLQYRFGKPDSQGALEMNWPESRVSPAVAASGDSQAFSGGGAAWLRIRKGDHAYVVYAGIGKWGRNGETQVNEGLVVERLGKSIAILKCRNPATSLLGPDWFGKTGVTSHGEEFDLPD